jgi:hypothetical protein
MTGEGETRRILKIVEVVLSEFLEGTCPAPPCDSKFCIRASGAAEACYTIYRRILDLDGVD